MSSYSEVCISNLTEHPTVRSSSIDHMLEHKNEFTKLQQLVGNLLQGMWFCYNEYFKMCVAVRLLKRGPQHCWSSKIAKEVSFFSKSEAGDVVF